MTTPRVLPTLTDVNRPYWTGGADGRLLIQRCDACQRWQHPPAPTCGACGGSVHVEPVSGRGTLFSYTRNEQQFHPDVPPPYLIGIVTLDEQDDLRLPTNVVDADESELSCGLPVQVRFEDHGEVFVPVFAPA